MTGAGIDMLTTLGEVGGITGVVSMALGFIFHMVKKRGCTCKLGPCCNIDCEEGAPGKRYLPKQSSPSASDPSTPSPSEAGASSVVVDIEM